MDMLLKFGIEVDSGTFELPRFETPRFKTVKLKIGNFKTGKLKMGLAENLGHIGQTPHCAMAATTEHLSCSMKYYGSAEEENKLSVGFGNDMKLPEAWSPLTD